MGKFIKLYESALQRFTRGGWLAGDRVKFKDNALSDEFFKTQPEQVRDQVKEFMSSDLNLVIDNIIPKYASAMSAGNTDYTGTEFTVDVMQELMPGKWTSPIAVPSYILVRLEDYPNLKPVPASLRYDNKVKIKPEPVSAKAEENEQVQFYKPGTHTHKSDHGSGKNVPGDRELLNKNTPIPSVEVDGPKGSASYTANYMPKASHISDYTKVK